MGTLRAALAICLLAGAPSLFAHEAEEHSRPSLDVWIDEAGEGWATITLPHAPADPDQVDAALVEALGCRPDEIDGGEEYGWQRWGGCYDSFHREGLMVSGKVRLTAVKRLFADEGVESLHVSIGHSSAAVMEGSSELGDFEQEWGYGYWNYEAAPEDGIDELGASFGYSAGSLRRAGLATLAVILLPALVVGLLGRRDVRRFEQESADVWLGFQGAMTVFILGGWAAWWAVVSYWRLDHLPSWVLGGPIFGDPPWDFLRNSVWAVPPALSSILATAASWRAHSRITGMELTRRQLTAQTGWMLAAILIPATLTFTALNSFGGGNYRNAVLLLFVTFVALILLAAKARQASGVKPQAITRGELRDRVFDLAERAGVQLRQLMLLPSGKHKMANAFAVGLREVMISERLLETLSKREVDAVLAHELAHLKHKHALTILPLTVGVLTAAGIALTAFMEWLPGWSYGAIAFVGVGLTFSFFSRRAERAADAGAVDISGDAEAFITGQAKVYALNMLPSDWSRGAEALLTHPSSQRRIEAAAKQAGISAERLDDLLQNPPEDVSERYEIPPIEEDEGRVFSAQAKMSLGLRKLAGDLVVGAFFPAAAIALWLHLEAPQGIAAELFAFALMAVVAAMLFYMDRREPLLGLDAIAAKLLASAEAEGLPIAEATPVGFGPQGEPQLYETSAYWDAGLIWIAGERLAYSGEQTRFSLRRDQIVSVERVASPIQVCSRRFLAFHWRDEASEREGAFYFSPLRKKTDASLFGSPSEIDVEISEWIAVGAMDTALPADVESWGPPEELNVSSRELREAAGFGPIIAGLMIVAFAAFAAAYLFNLSFSEWTGPAGAGWAAAVVAVNARGLTLVADLFGARFVKQRLPLDPQARD